MTGHVKAETHLVPSDQFPSRTLATARSGTTCFHLRFLDTVLKNIITNPHQGSGNTVTEIYDQLEFFLTDPPSNRRHFHNNRNLRRRGQDIREASRTITSTETKIREKAYTLELSDSPQQEDHYISTPEPPVHPHKQLLKGVGHQESYKTHPNSLPLIYLRRCVHNTKKTFGASLEDMRYIEHQSITRLRRAPISDTSAPPTVLPGIKKMLVGRKTESGSEV
ncbi:hypothetical protein EDC94DRAFT_681947 [Helicostylum pulchrum]|nr:hypothetical protein EDC94DRAFT_681947 [Helicostylum pulchrum]